MILAAGPVLSAQAGYVMLTLFGILWIGLGMWWGRRAKSYEGFTVAGRNVGLALATAPRAELDAEVERLLEGVRGRSRRVLAMVKRLVSAPQSMTLDEGLHLERKLFDQFIHDVPDAAEGFTAYVEKRPAVWGDADVSAFA